MTEQAAIWRQTADKWTDVANRLTDDDWSKPTTCDEFTVRELVDHAMRWQATGGGLIGAGTSPGEAWDAVRPALSAALDDPSNLEGSVEEFGGMTAHEAAAQAAPRLPGLAERVTGAAEVFDALAYGHRSGSARQYQEMRELDAEAARTRPVLPVMTTGEPAAVVVESVR